MSTTIANLFLSLLILTSLCACESAQQRLQDRREKLSSFSTKVVQHLLDRDPKTYRGSVGFLMREELDDDLIDKLQMAGELPEPGLEELKIVNDAEDNHTSNVVKAANAQAMGPVDKDVVLFQVSGKVISYKQARKISEIPFRLHVDCKLTDSMQGYPRAIAIQGLDLLPSQLAKPFSAKAAGRSRSRRV